MGFVVDNAALGRVILCVLLLSPIQSYPTHAAYSLIYYPVDRQCVRGHTSTHSLVHHDYNKNLGRNVSFPPGQTLLSNSSDTNQEAYYSHEDRIPAAARFSAPVQTDPEAHLDSCTRGTGSFPGVKRLGRGVDHQCQGCKGVGEKKLSLSSVPAPLPLTHMKKTSLDNDTRNRTTIPAPTLYITSSSKRVICLYKNYSLSVVLAQTKSNVITHIKHLQ